MFPLSYPLRILRSKRVRQSRRLLICDPYCGRGTTIFAARTLGVRAYGIDVAPVAVAIAQAKAASAEVADVVGLAKRLIHNAVGRRKVPRSEFWRHAYHPQVLRDVCAIREGLFGLKSDAAAILRAVMLGALHGPMTLKAETASYFSNQMPRTFASKPRYSVGYWERTGTQAPKVDVIAIIRRRTERALKQRWSNAATATVDVRCSDSRKAQAFRRLPRKITHVITSPPYYGLRTYSQDQWLRHWFLGGPPNVDYRAGVGMDHGSPEAFARSMARVWDQVGSRARKGARLYVRFGGIPSRSADPDEIFKASLRHSQHRWRIVTRHSARSADEGKRQAEQMNSTQHAMTEFDYVVALA